MIFGRRWPGLPWSGDYPPAAPPVTVLIVIAKAALVAFLWSPTGHYYGYARTPLPRGSTSTATSSIPTTTRRPARITPGTPEQDRAVRR
ncbi:hypothetical protein [Mycobacterium sp. SA01]|uniref:hypothetical protein n=1 Tax=Mycobacterium sp. SA01 TaxID=3238820 RepID=UPI00351AF4BD